MRSILPLTHATTMREVASPRSILPLTHAAARSRSASPVDAWKVLAEVVRDTATR